MSRSRRLRPTPWPAAAVLIVLSVALAIGFGAERHNRLKLSATTSGVITDGTTGTRSNGNHGSTTYCKGTLVYRVEGVRYTDVGTASGACPRDGSNPEVTVHYDPSSPSNSNTAGPETLTLTGLVIFFVLLAVASVALLVHSLKCRREDRRVSG